MTFARAVNLPKGLGRTVFRRAGASGRLRSSRQIGQRGYASGHGQQKSSEIPWIIGSAAVTIPAAAWLLGQAPKKSDHGHGDHHAEHAEKEVEEEEPQEEEPQEEEPQEEEPQEESKEEEPKEESQDDGKEESKDESKDEDDKKEEGGDEEKADDSKSEDSDKQESGDKSEDKYEAPGPNAPKQINWDSSKSKGPGEGQKGERKPSEKKGEKDKQGDFSGAKHPYINDPEKSKKGIGVTETAKIHGTVDSRPGARGVGDTGKSADD